MRRPSPSLLLLPAAGGVFVTSYLLVGMLRQSFDVRPNYVAAAIVTWVFTLLSRSWFLRKSVLWTPLRARHTTWAALATGAIAVGFALVGLQAGGDLALLLGSLGPPVLWILSTAWIWRESDAEHRKRLLDAGDLSVTCPTCAYNLRGLKGTRCPECGTEYTLDELFACQATSRASAPLPAPVGAGRRA